MVQKSEPLIEVHVKLLQSLSVLSMRGKAQLRLAADHGDDWPDQELHTISVLLAVAGIRRELDIKRGAHQLVSRIIERSRDLEV